MIRKYSFIAAVILAVGIGPALAANVFVGGNTKSKSGEETTIYNKVKPNAYTQKQAVVKYGARLNVQDQLAQSEIVAATAEEMREMGFKPSNAEEMLIYANAHRAVHQNLMYKRRQALMEHQNKVEFARVKRDLLKNSRKAAFKATAGGVSKSSSKSEEPETPKKTRVLKRRPVYVTKSAEDKAKPTKVFKDY